MSPPSRRRTYLDWLRGLAVLIMIEAHLLDSWTRVPDRETREFAYAMIAGGFGAPLFLFLAGVAVPLSAASKLARGGSTRAAAGAVARRGLEVFGLAFLFRAQAWILGWGRARSLLKVDILNIMGPSIAAAAGLWALGRTHRARIALFTVATLLVTLGAPGIRSLPAIAALPDFLRAYVSPVPDLSNFVFFPWAGFVFAGAIVGLILDRARAADAERRANLAFLVCGLGLAYAAHRLSFLPSPIPHSQYWTTSSSFFALRVGILTAAVGSAYLREMLRRDGRWSVLELLGRRSLFIYWIHVELVYGLISLDLHGSLSWGQAWIGYVLFCVFMVVCALAKERYWVVGSR
jgi:uncharacterized membrane protein